MGKGFERRAGKDSGKMKGNRDKGEGWEKDLRERQEKRLERRIGIWIVDKDGKRV
jgi:hypothetical protein